MGAEAAKLVVMTSDELRALIRDELAKVAKPDEWMTADDVAQMLCVKRGSIPALVLREGLPCYRPGRTYTFKRAEVEEWLRERMNKPGARPRKKVVALVRGSRP